MSIKVEEGYTTPNTVGYKRNTSQYIIIKSLNTQKKDNIK